MDGKRKFRKEASRAAERSQRSVVKSFLKPNWYDFTEEARRHREPVHLRRRANGQGIRVRGHLCWRRDGRSPTEDRSPPRSSSLGSGTRAPFCSEIYPHWLNHGGNRQANAALYRVVIVSMWAHHHALDNVRRRTAGGKSKPEIIRCLKRSAACEILGYLCRPPLMSQTAPAALERHDRTRRGALPKDNAGDIRIVCATIPTNQAAGRSVIMRPSWD
jgi:hypothetical protein